MPSFPTLPAPDEIDAVIFDAGGVLLLPDAVAAREALAGLGCEITADQWQRAHYTSCMAYDRMGKPDWPQLRRVIARSVGLDGDSVEAAIPVIDGLITATPWVGVVGAAGVLRALIESGYQVAVVSNSVGTVEAELERAAICSTSAEGMPRIGVVIDSTVVGITKPDPRIFQMALEAIGVAPERSVYVGDIVSVDVVGARAAGMHAVHMNPYNLCTDSHPHISDLQELEDHFFGK